MDLKQVIIIRNDLKLPKGKMAAQAAHASVEAVLRADKDNVKKWRLTGMAKIVLKVDSEKDLLKYLQIAKDSNLTSALITDAGRTCIEPGTRTCIAIGPNDSDTIDRVTSSLKLM